MQQGNLNLTWNANTSFYGYVSDNNIYTNLGEQIGVNLAKYQEVEQALIKCKNRLIELGEIKVPKTPDEIIKEQSEMIEKQNQAINQMLARIEDLSNEYRNIKGGNELYTEEHKGESNTIIEPSIDDSRPDANKNKGRCNKSTSADKK
ncbi:MAG: hypothetical protein ACI4S3_07410 [Candidatus Gastranaerophilaceae bacterium]